MFLSSIIKWFAGRGGRQVKRGDQEARLGVETLEGREVPAQILGYNTPGMWSAGRERISFIATDFQGSFTYANAQRAYKDAVNWSVWNNRSLDRPGPVALHTHQASGDHHLLIAWYNLDEHVGGWIAGDFSTSYSTLVNTGPWWNRQTHTETHTTMNWLTNDGQSGRNVEGWKPVDWTTNHGYHIDLSLVPTSSGDVDAYFRPPYSVAE